MTNVANKAMDRISTDGVGNVESVLWNFDKSHIIGVMEDKT